MFTSSSQGTTADADLMAGRQDFLDALEASVVPARPRCMTRSGRSAAPDMVRHGAFQLKVDRENPLFLAHLNATPMDFGKFRSLTGAIAQAVELAGAGAIGCQAVDLLTIFDLDERLVLAGATMDGGVAWCHPVRSDAEARAVAQEACALRGQAMRREQGHGGGSAQELRWRARLLDGRLVDPFWRSAACQALGLDEDCATSHPTQRRQSATSGQEAVHA